MATTMHATNEQCALIMGWYEWNGMYFREPEGKNYTGYTVKGGDRPWQPVINLNHTALVEARLIELRDIHKWRFRNQYIDNLYELLGISDDTSEYTRVWKLATATAQTRCDAAWATWQQWKEQAT